MKINYSDGSFMLSWDKVRAWYNADGTMKDCEYKRTFRGYPSAAAVPTNHHNMRAWLKKQGEMEVRRTDLSK